MELCRVRYFLAVCEHGSFTAAANACGVTQPSVTTGVRRLERLVGGKLFERRHPVRLTPLGAALRPLLRRIQDTADLVIASVAERANGAGVDERQIDLDRAVNNLFGRPSPWSERVPARASHRQRETAASATLLAHGPAGDGDRRTTTAGQGPDPDRTTSPSAPWPQALAPRSRIALRRADEPVEVANLAPARSDVSLP